jgi:hypothetical protein
MDHGEKETQMARTMIPSFFFAVIGKGTETCLNSYQLYLELEGWQEISRDFDFKGP